MGINEDMENISERTSIRVSVRDLVEFVLRSGDIDNRHKDGPSDLIAMQEGSRIHRMIQKRMGADYRAEVPLRVCVPMDEYDVIIEGRADGIIGSGAKDKPKDLKAEDTGRVTIDEIKSTHTELDLLKEPKPVHLAQAKCYAYIFLNENGLDEIGVRMTYCNADTLEIKYFHETYTSPEIRKWFDKVIKLYKRWTDFEFNWKRSRNASIEGLEFPFDYREGQRQLMGSVYHCIRAGERMFIQAPTGTGKTVATVFPSVKAMGEGLLDKIFYLTAKTVTRAVAGECTDTLRAGGLKLKSAVITAKEKICPLDEMKCDPDGCPYAKGHFDRVNDAMYELLTSEDSFDKGSIERQAKKHMVCPFEMSLDMTLFSDLIICDYNYVFDPNVYLRRYFAEGMGGDFLFLIDEAHNLVDRGMDMYSADLAKEDFLELKRYVKPFDVRLEKALDSVNRAMLEHKRECKACRVISDITGIITALTRLMSQFERFLEKDSRDYHQGVMSLEAHYPKVPDKGDESGGDKEPVLELYFKVRHFLNMYDNMGKDDYVIYERFDDDKRFILKLLCVNPSGNIRKCIDKGTAAVFFSATLLPIQYYKDMLTGDDKDTAVYARSVFDTEKRGLFIANDVSSRYTRRNEREYHNIASYIDRIVSNREGNYLVFFPSHAFLEKVYEAYEEFFIKEGVECLIQKRSMGEDERSLFLSRFDETKGSLIGFCVMGGIFAEGIDLKGEKLIGSIIVGTGLPMVCEEREILKDCYIKTGADGFDYAYRFPGMNKVMQAAGRVIRTGEDTGIVVLLDERFHENCYRRLFPREWKDYRTVSLGSVEKEVRAFWDKFT